MTNNRNRLIRLIFDFQGHAGRPEFCGVIAVTLSLGLLTEVMPSLRLSDAYLAPLFEDARIMPFLKLVLLLPTFSAMARRANDAGVERRQLWRGLAVGAAISVLGYLLLFMAMIAMAFPIILYLFAPMAAFPIVLIGEIILLACLPSKPSTEER